MWITVKAVATLIIVAPAAPAFAACVAHQVIDVQGIGHSFTVLVPAAELTGYAVKGFLATPCALTEAQMVTENVNICKLAAIRNPAVQNRFEKLLGEQPSKMCASSKALLAQVGAGSPVSPNLPVIADPPLHGAR